MKAKIILIALCVLICVFALLTVASAEEYTVFSSEEFKTAFDTAVDGDTIVIKADITGELEFGKSITYIIDGNYTWLAGGRANAEDKTVSIYARNGNGVFMPNAAMWMNSYEPDVTVKLENTVWNLGALDKESTLTFDLTKVVTRLFFDVKFKEINFKSGTEITNCDNSKQDNTFYFRAITVNLYEGASIHEVYVAPYRGFIDCTTFNIYGGEIYNCYFSEYGMVLGKTVNMYGGEVHDVYLYFTNTGVNEGVFNNINFYMYSGEIYNNYVRAAKTSAHSILAGNKHLVGGSVHNNYVFTSWSSAPKKDENGVYSVDGLDLSQGTEAGNGVGNTTVYEYSVLFKNSDGSIIAAYLVKDGAIKSTVADATEVTVPQGYEWTLSSNCCIAFDGTIATDKAGVYYVVAPHTPMDDDFDCKTILVCGACEQTICEAKADHAIKESLSYSDYCGYGLYVCDCVNEGCLVVDVVNTEYAPIITMLGYSVQEGENGANVGIVQGFVVNTEVVGKFEQINNIALSYGAVVAVENSLGGAQPLYIENGKVKANSEKVLTYNVSNGMYDVFEIKLVGINLDGKHPEQLDVKIIACAYISNGERISYIDNGVSYDTAPSKSYNEIK